MPPEFYYDAAAAFILATIAGLLVRDIREIVRQVIHYERSK